MSGYMGFDEWFLFATAVLGTLTGFALFTLKRFDIAVALFLVWFCLVFIEYFVQKREFEKWKRRVFQ